MSRAWSMLVALALVLAVAAGMFARRPRPVSPTTSAPVARAPMALTLMVRDSTLTPPEISVPLHAHVALTFNNTGRSPVVVSLMGYEDVVHAGVAPGGTRSLAFDADRPGEDFAWTLDGRPVGRVRVTGSHLVEGHR